MQSNSRPGDEQRGIHQPATQTKQRSAESAQKALDWIEGVFPSGGITGNTWNHYKADQQLAGGISASSMQGLHLASGGGKTDSQRGRQMQRETQGSLYAFQHNKV